mmetsp:Transcript_14596/g.42179  ORF Transcript_14596/g.42179 Transcript_14596/m.42179 type:complete len:107 (-) Transcript_14596:109-429(-)
MFVSLPEFWERYSWRLTAVVRVNMMAGGVYAFVEFADEVLASTAILMDGFMLAGKKVRVQRPSRNRGAFAGFAQGLDVGPLRQMGLLPMEVGWRGSSARPATKLTA